MAVQGTWSNIPIIGGLFSQDRGWTEALTGGKWGGSTLNNPAYQSVPGVYENPYQISTQNVTINPNDLQSGLQTKLPKQDPGTIINNNQTISPNTTPLPDERRFTPEELYRRNMENSINAGWDSYTNQLNEMLNTGLTGQRNAQEQIATASRDQSINALNTQRKASESAVIEQKAKNLNDLAGNMRNLFQAGNTYLGARGAGDSSATNMYSYALTKLGTQQRGQINNAADSRMNQIGDIYNSEITRIDTDKNMRFAQIADWFNNAQNAVRQQIASAGINRQQDIQALSQNIYNQAIGEMQRINNEAAGMRTALTNWATYNASNAQQLTANMRTIQQMPAYQGINAGVPQVMSNGQYYVPTGYRSYQEDQGLFNQFR